MTESSNPYRLARTVVPSAYRIFLTPDLEKATFAGRVEVDIEITETMSEMTLHALDLELGAATVSSDGTSYRSLEHRWDETYQTVTFVFDRDLPPGPAVFEIAFDGVLNDKLVGFYRSTFVDDQGTTHVIATTQFEETDARRAFPCWDEPIFKATYQVNLTIPSHLAAYSNSPLDVNTDLGNGQRSLSFKPTMKMSTYLVAFVIGPFEETPAVDVDGVPLRVVTPIGKLHLTDLALEAGVFGLRWFSEYFGIPYPGEKLDMIAIPDFAAGAMENLGCITYRETALLVDPATSSQAEIQRVAEVVHHEIAHMWFGDLVTMEWWQGIWLNEAFATFMQLLCTNAFRPTWRVWVTQNTFRNLALQVDGLDSTRPIEYEVISPADTHAMFDLLTYEKGGSTLRMLEQYLGEDVFRDGVRLYLRKHSYANTVTTDLWDALEENSGQPVREMMNTWILQGGVPLVTLEKGQLSQQPFRYGPAKSPSAIGDHWLIPALTRSLDGGEPSRHLLNDEALTVSDPAPVVLNAGGWGVFRSRYGNAELTALSPRVSELEEIERATLLADSWAALFAGSIAWSDFFEVARGLGHQDEPNPWEFVATAFDMAKRALNETQREILRTQLRELFEPQLARLGWDAKDSDGELTPQLRAVVIGALGGFGEDEAVRAEAIRRYEAGALEGDLAQPILRVVATQDRPRDYEAFLEHYRRAATPQEQMRYLIALGSFNEERVALDAAEKAFSEFRTQDAPLVLSIWARNEVTGPAVWRYMTSRWDEATARFPVNSHARLAGGVTTFINDQALADEAEAFHRAHPVSGGYPMNVNQQLELMRVGIAFAASMRQQF
ncbi:MAG: putative aminopeptidase [Acidimicrobiaceae bacterium]|nr:putative aminopeptidase [Acidimicrobiaceae bacterium]